MLSRIDRTSFLNVMTAAGVAELGLLGAAHDTKTLRVRIGSDISNLDPLRIFAIPESTVACNIYNSLLKFDEKTEQDRR